MMEEGGVQFCTAKIKIFLFFDTALHLALDGCSYKNCVSHEVLDYNLSNPGLETCDSNVIPKGMRECQQFQSYLHPNSSLLTLLINMQEKGQLVPLQKQNPPFYLATKIPPRIEACIVNHGCS